MMRTSALGFVKRILGSILGIDDYSSMNGGSGPVTVSMPP